MSKNLSHPLPVEEQIGVLEPLLKRLMEAHGVKNKLYILDGQSAVGEFLGHSKILKNLLKKCSLEGEFAIKSLLALGQGPIIFQQMELLADPLPEFQALLNILMDVEKFYNTIGGIVGYHVTVLKLIACKKEPPRVDDKVRYLHPHGLDLVKDRKNAHKAVRWGIENMPIMAELYPVGGAGDRLMLVDDKTGEPLPAAQLNFCGRTLLEGLIRDLQGREYLHYKFYGKQLTIPVAMMTSHEKNNDYQIKKICSEKKWFGRSRESFLFFTQPLVPVINKEGDWCAANPLKVVLKPGGHGIMWKLAHDEKIFEAWKARGCRKVLVRQINNPVAGTDQGLLALTGIGCKRDKAFGFASCPRVLKAPEGMNVIIEKKTLKITNIG